MPVIISFNRIKNHAVARFLANELIFDGLVLDQIDRDDYPFGFNAVFRFMAFCIQLDEVASEEIFFACLVHIDIFSKSSGIGLNLFVYRIFVDQDPVKG